MAATRACQSAIYHVACNSCMLYSKPTHKSSAEQRNWLQLEHVKASSMMFEFWLGGSRLQCQTMHQAAEGGPVTSESCGLHGLQLEVGQVPSMADVPLLIQACFVAQRLGAASRASSQVGMRHAFGSPFSALEERGEISLRVGRLAYLLLVFESRMGPGVLPDLSWSASPSLPCVVFHPSW